MTIDQAKNLAQQHLDQRSSAESRYAIQDEFTISRPYGWVFFWNAREFIETGNPGYRVIGNGPLLVTDVDGIVHRLGSSIEPVAKRLETWEATDGKRYLGNS